MGNKNTSFLNDLFLNSEKIMDEGMEEEKSRFERLPKIILCKILGYLDGKNLLKIWVLNRFFLRFLSESSNYINQFWKNFADLEVEDENEINLCLKKINLKKYELNLNKYMLYVKVSKKKKKYLQKLIFFPKIKKKKVCGR